MKLRLRIVVGLALGLLMVSCKTDETNDSNKIAFQKISNMLYEVTYDNYSSEPVGTYEEINGEMACSSVRNGNYHGRNFDFFMNQSSSIVIHTTAKPNRYATIGVARLAKVNDEMINSGLTDRQIQILPWAMVDGINEKGLVVNANVVAKSDEGTIPHTGTKPGAPELNIFFAIRAMLDNCATVQEALNYLNAHNITPFASQKTNLHLMISDTIETYVVEIINNAIVAKPQIIMTNYFVNMDTIPNHALGVERYKILSEHYAEGGTSMEGMWNLMKRVRYSESYYAKNKWYSEIAASHDINYKDIPLYYDTLDKILEEYESKWIAEKEYILNNGLRTDTPWWNTSSNSVYDIKNKILWVTVHEQYDQKHEFRL
ncbi:MAG: linear amide C-N hydrolase [Bacteroidales bacterium]|nr:linear amide C-N hydrolase [Candidatus Colimorpha onthohippi]